MNDNQHEKPTFKDVYWTKSGRIAKKTKQYIDETWYYLFLASGLMMNKPNIMKCEMIYFTKQHTEEMWFI